MKNKEKFLRIILPILSSVLIIISVVSLCLSIVKETIPLYNRYKLETGNDIYTFTIGELFMVFLTVLVPIILAITNYYIIMKKNNYDNFKLTPEDIYLLNQYNNMEYLKVKANEQYKDVKMNLRKVRVICPYCDSSTASIPGETIKCQSCASNFILPVNLEETRKNQYGVFIGEKTN